METVKLTPGQEAPEFTLPNQDEQEVALSSMKGKWVVLYFYPKDNTSGCTLEARDFTSQLPGFRELDADIIGISPDSCKSHRGFITKQDLKLTLLSDTEHKVCQLYGAWGVKKMYGKEYEGVIRSTFLIDPEGKIAEVWYKVKVNGHVDQVKEKLTSLKG
ncbi:MAG: thioredoxin-dependent thiol peroxidase [Firmicutes bacterium]|nr:thioredoxin-dependent thiol peroxidase [Bacillota bacterium]